MGWLIKAIRLNMLNIILYLSTVVIQWRLHEYSHLILTWIYGCDILMGLDRWLVGCTDMEASTYIMASGVSTNMVIGFLGLYLLVYRDGLSKVYGFYLLFSGLIMNLLSVGVSIPATMSIGGEIIFKIFGIPILLTMFLLGVRYSGIRVKASCIGWLTILTAIAGATIVGLDRLFWLGYSAGIWIFQPYMGLISAVYIFDPILALILTMLLLRAIKQMEHEYNII